MAPLRRFFARLVAFLSPARAERELSRELSAHLVILEDDYRRRGMSEEQASAAARRALGGLDAAKEIHRDHRSFAWLEDLRRDVPYALRGLKRNPSFTAAVIVTVALGVGVTTAIFTVVNTILLRPLPYRDDDRLVQLAENVVRQGPNGPIGSRRFGLNQSEFLEWRRRTTTFAQIAGVANLMNNTLETPEGHISAPRAIVSPSLFEMLGVPAQLGRTLLPEDERVAAEAVVISDTAWRRFFNADPDVLGRRITLLTASFTIVGVMPPHFEYPERSTLFWTPLAPRPGTGTNAFGNVIAKLKPGVSIAAATEEANAIGSAVRTPSAVQGYGASALPPPPPVSATLGGPPHIDTDIVARPRFEVIAIKNLIVDPIRPAMHVLAGAVVVLLLIVCANVANLLLARGTARQREIGVRLAIGAGRGRIIRQLVTESAVLSIAGGAAGILVAAVCVQLVRTLATVDTPRLYQLSINLGDGSLLPRIGELRMDASLVTFAAGIALVAGFVFGFAPAVFLSQTHATRSIAGGGSTRFDSSHSSRGRLRSALVVAQVFMATTLLLGAGLLVHSFAKLLSVDPGFDTENVLTFQLTLPPETPGERQLAIIEGVMERLQSDHRVAAVGYTNIPPFLSLTEYGGLFVPPGFAREEMLSDPLRPQTRIVSHQYLRAMGARLLEGRWLSDGDGATQPLSLVVNRALAQRYFGQQSPIGASVRVFRSAEYIETWQIIGVVDDVVQARLDQEPFPVVFADMRQVLAARARMPKALQLGQGLPGFATIVVRANGSWEPLAREVRPMLRSLDPTLSVNSIVPLQQLRHGSLVRPRFYAVLIGAFAVVAGVLAAVGIYGVLAYAVVQRTHEIGVRMALGAQRATVLAGVLRHGLTLTAVGIVLGFAGALGLAQNLATMLFGLTPVDTTTYAGVALGFCAVSLLACYLPARRATRVDPVTALRCD